LITPERLQVEKQGTDSEDIVMPIGFRWRPVALTATVVAVALGLALGQWQTRRAAEKEVIAARWLARESAAPLVLQAGALTADELEYRRLRVKGEFIGGWPVYLDNRPYQGRAGFYLLMPFRIAGSSRYLMVARGWLPRNSAERTRMAPFATPAGSIEIEGTVKRSPARLLQLGNPAPLQPNAIVQNLDLAEFSRASQLPLLPFMLEQSGPATAQDNLVRDWPPPASGIDKHRAYAFQWYALAAMALVFYAATGFRHATTSPR
jgi:surfeit locus 1 family protein